MTAPIPALTHLLVVPGNGICNASGSKMKIVLLSERTELLLLLMSPLIYYFSIKILPGCCLPQQQHICHSVPEQINFSHCPKKKRLFRLLKMGGCCTILNAVENEKTTHYIGNEKSTFSLSFSTPTTFNAKSELGRNCASTNKLCALLTTFILYGSALSETGC